MGKFYLRNATQRTICKAANCRCVVSAPSRFCPKHKKQEHLRNGKRKERDRFLDTQAWRDMSAWKLRTDPWCEHCMKEGKFTPANDVDHIVPRVSAPSLSLDGSNLQSLCKSCHAKKTTQEQD